MVFLKPIHCIVIYLTPKNTDNDIHRINLCPGDSAIGFPVTYPLGSIINPMDSGIQRLNNWALVDGATHGHLLNNQDMFRSSTNFIFHDYEVQWTNFSVSCLFVCLFVFSIFKSPGISHQN